MIKEQNLISEYCFAESFSAFAKVVFDFSEDLTGFDEKIFGFPEYLHCIGEDRCDTSGVRETEVVLTGGISHLFIHFHSQLSLFNSFIALRSHSERQTP